MDLKEQQQLKRLLRKQLKKLKQVVELLRSLHAFNKLDATTISIITDVFSVDAEEICREYGITYFL